MILISSAQTINLSKDGKPGIDKSNNYLCLLT